MSSFIEHAKSNDSSDDKCEDPCGADTRAEAYAKAVAWSGVGDSGVPIPWSDYRGKGGPNYTHVKQQGEQYGGAWDQNSKGQWKNHPDGHPDQISSGYPDHHKCPHFRAINPQGVERVFEYKRGT